MKQYQEMTAAEKDAIFHNHPPVHHVYWVLAAGQRIGHVYALPLHRAGTLWQATGARQAWVAVHRLGRLGDTHSKHDYFATKALAAAAVVRYEKYRKEIAV